MNGNCSLSCRGKSSLVAKMLVISQWFLNKHDILTFHSDHWLLNLNNYLQSHSCSSSFVIVLRFLQHVSPVELQGKTCSSDSYKILKISQGCAFFLPYQYQGQKGDLRGDQKRFVYKFFFIYEFAHQPPTQTQPTYYDFNWNFLLSFLIKWMSRCLLHCLPMLVTSNTILI